MHSVKLYRIVTGVVLAFGIGFAWAPSLAHEKEVHATGKSGRVPMPVLTINTTKGDLCVEPREVMLRDHMKLILHQRDKTVHDGIRTTKHGLKNCVDCHADAKTGSVLGKDGFCESCHAYAAVKLDCFECHSALREAATVTPSSASTVRALNDKQKKASESAKGRKP